MTSFHKALVLSSADAEHQVETVPTPKPAKGQLLVKIIAAALNPADWKMHAAKLVQDLYPFTGGFDGAGIVEEVGSDTMGFTKGDRVIVQAWRDETQKVFQGVFQQYVLMPTYMTVKIPKETSFDEAAPFFSCITTVAIPLYSPKLDGTPSLRLTAPWDSTGQGAYSGKSIFIPGGATNVGQFAIQLAKLSGFSPIITTASLRNKSLLTSFGATHILDRTLSSEKIIADVQEIAGGPVYLAYDPVSEAETLKICVSVLRTSGQLAIVIPGSDNLIKDSIGEKKLQVVVAFGAVFGNNRGALDGLWAVLPEWLEKGLIKPVPYEVLPGGLSAVPGGLQRLKAGQVSAVKLVIHPQETE